MKIKPFGIYTKEDLEQELALFTLEKWQHFTRYSTPQILRAQTNYLIDLMKGETLRQGVRSGRKTKEYERRIRRGIYIKI